MVQPGTPYGPRHLQKCLAAQEECQCFGLPCMHYPCMHYPCMHYPCMHYPCMHYPCMHYPCMHYPCMHYPCMHYPCMHYPCMHYPCLHYPCMHYPCKEHLCTQYPCIQCPWGRFRTAPIITVIIQVTTLKTTHLRNHAQSIQNSKIQTSDACDGSQGPKFCPRKPRPLQQPFNDVLSIF